MKRSRWRSDRSARRRPVSTLLAAPLVVAGLAIATPAVPDASAHAGRAAGAPCAARPLLSTGGLRLVSVAARRPRLVACVPTRARAVRIPADAVSIDAAHRFGSEVGVLVRTREVDAAGKPAIGAVILRLNLRGTPTAAPIRLTAAATANKPVLAFGVRPGFAAVAILTGHQLRTFRVTADGSTVPWGAQHLYGPAPDGGSYELRPSTGTVRWRVKGAAASAPLLTAPGCPLDGGEVASSPLVRVVRLPKVGVWACERSTGNVVELGDPPGLSANVSIDGPDDDTLVVSGPYVAYAISTASDPDVSSYYRLIADLPRATYHVAWVTSGSDDSEDLGPTFLTPSGTLITVTRVFEPRYFKQYELCPAYAPTPTATAGAPYWVIAATSLDGADRSLDCQPARPGKPYPREPSPFTELMLTADTLSWRVNGETKQAPVI